MKDYSISDLLAISECIAAKKAVWSKKLNRLNRKIAYYMSRLGKIEDFYLEDFERDFAEKHGLKPDEIHFPFDNDDDHKPEWLDDYHREKDMAHNRIQELPRYQIDKGFIKRFLWKRDKICIKIEKLRTAKEECLRLLDKKVRKFIDVVSVDEVEQPRQDSNQNRDN